MKLSRYSMSVSSTILFRICYGLHCSLLILLFNILFVAVLTLVLVRSVEKELRPHLYNISYVNVQKNKPSALNETDFIKMHKLIQDDPEHIGYDGTWLVVVLVFALLIILLKEIVDLASEVSDGAIFLIRLKSNTLFAEISAHPEIIAHQKQ